KNGDQSPATGAVYTTNNSSVATVDTNGKVTPTGLGIATITLQANGKTASTRVIVISRHTFAHFSKGGQILNQYTPGSSIFVRSLFNSLDPPALPALKAGGMNAFEEGIPIDPANLDPAHWQAAFDP